MRKKLTNFERISSKSDIHRLLKNKTKYYSRHLGITSFDNSRAFARMFVCVRSAKALSAVERNRHKRLGRELFRNNKLLLPSGCDIGIIVVPLVAKVSFSRLEHEYRELLSKLKGAEYGKKNNRCCSNIDHNNC